MISFDYTVNVAINDAQTTPKSNYQTLDTIQSTTVTETSTKHTHTHTHDDTISVRPALGFDMQ